MFLRKVDSFYEKRACKLNTDMQNGFIYYVKIGFRILTTIFTNKALNKISSLLVQKTL
jgi:hypothetical protein